MISLTNAQKERIAVLYYRDNQSQESLAQRFEVSRRTIGRALKEKGILTRRHQITARDRKYLEVIDEYRITPNYLRELLERDQNRRICIG